MCISVRCPCACRSIGRVATEVGRQYEHASESEREEERETDIQTEGSNCITSFVAAEVGTPIQDHVTSRSMRNGFNGAVPGAWLC